MAAHGRFFSSVILSILLSNALYVCANDILGCGGFIKSHVNLDFSKVDIKLFTKQGTLKEKTECAPTNGYYFLPLYEHGEYVLKVDPPPGWSIEPSEIPLNVDGVNDPCSKGQDVNFVFSGFGITGRVVTAGNTIGPPGVSVHLISEKGDVRDTTTKYNGDFHFTPVIPGKYTLKAYHPVWKLEPSSTIVQVSGGNTALKVGSLAVRGYDVRGIVMSHGKPLSGLHVMLYAAEGTNPLYKIEGCNSGLLQGIDDNPICYVVTNESGEFAFDLVPAGSYYLVPLERQPGNTKATFNVQPKRVDFKVEHDSVGLKTAFEVSGFTINGLVSTNRGGVPLTDAQILLDRRAVAVTDKNGRYTIQNLKANTYSLQVIADGCEFDDTLMTISPDGTSNVVDLHPARWRVCGNIRSPGTSKKQRAVIIKSATQPSDAPKTALTEENDNWCLYLSPGSYLASVKISDDDKRDGLQFFPLSQKISVGFKPVTGITFSQLKATLRGSIKCMKDNQHPSCLNIPITLRPHSDGGYNVQPIVANTKDGRYELKEVLPGSYEVTVPTESLCWSTPKHTVSVTSTEATIPEFVQTGYAVTFTMSHKSKVHYEMSGSKVTLDVPAGVSQHCLPTAGEYVFTPEGCHIYEPTSVTYNTRQSDNMIVINAVSHSVGISIHSADIVDDLKLKIVNEATVEVGPLKPQPNKQDGMHVYRHTVMLPHGKTAHVTPSSKLLLFTPPGMHTISAAGGDCIDVGLLFTAAKGKVLSGKITPAIQGVTVTLEGGGKDLVQVTEADGKYHFGPLDASLTYKLRAEKESYVVTGPDAAGNFQAQKLAQIDVKIIDSVTKEPLQGALVSVSGGSYRRNLATGNDGQLSFPSLAPGEYYLKPLMKEYKFTPPHRIVPVKEGESHLFELSGVRVACSGVGNVATLGGSGLGGVNVIAEPTTGADPSRCPPEEAITDRDTGAFRIRGLLKGCSYRLRLKSTVDLGISNVIPTHIDLEVKSEAEDIQGMRFIAVQPLLVTDSTVLVYTPKIEHYKTLKLKLSTEAEPTAHVFQTKLDATGYAPGINPGLMFTLPRLPADNKTYILQLHSTLSKSANIYNLEPIYFNSDGKFKHFRIEFEPKVKISEQDVNQPSILILPLLGLLVLAFLNKEKVLEVAMQFIGSLSDKIAVAAAQNRQNNQKSNYYTMDDNQIDQIVQNINAIKKKPKPRKA